MSDDLFDALGGEAAIIAVVDRFYERLVIDPLVQHQFHPDRLPSLKAGQVRWFSAVLAGKEPPVNLAQAHADVRISDEQIEAVLTHLDETLIELGVPIRLRRATNAVVARLWHARLL